jgi:L-aspartate oxidase
MQFHPTALYSKENPTLLITEALRGEGAFLVDDDGKRFMLDAHPRAELAPRDIVVRQIERVLNRERTDHIWLDARHLDCDFLRERFPTVQSGLEKRGLDLCSQLIPVAPASHYYIGGVLSDVWGRTSIPGLYACGETASTGIHGANRLASNSLLEGLVFGDRTVRDLNGYLAQTDPAVRKIRLNLADQPRAGNDSAAVAQFRAALGAVMMDACGIVRDVKGLERARTGLAAIAASIAPPGLTVPELELINLLAVAQLMVKSATVREESRGVHLRSDFSAADDDHWRRHISLKRDRLSGDLLIDPTSTERRQ